MAFSYQYLVFSVIFYSFFGAQVGTLSYYICVSLFCLPVISFIYNPSSFPKYTLLLILLIFISSVVGVLNYLFSPSAANVFTTLFLSDFATFLFILIPLVYISLSSIPKFQFFQSLVAFSSLCLCLRFFFLSPRLPSALLQSVEINLKGAIHIYSDPIVLLSGSLLIPYLLYYSKKDFRWHFIFFELCSFISLATLLLTGSRTVILSSLLVSLIYISTNRFDFSPFIQPFLSLRFKFNYLILIAIILFGLIVVSPLLYQLFILFSDKTSVVLLNSRDFELQTVLDSVFSSSFNLLFGSGFSSTIVVPYRDLPVPYTHSIISYLLLKGGFIGLFLGILFALKFLFACCRKNRPALFSQGGSPFAFAPVVVLFCSYLFSTSYRYPDVELLWFLALI